MALDSTFARCLGRACPCTAEPTLLERLRESRRSPGEQRRRWIAPSHSTRMPQRLTSRPRDTTRSSRRTGTLRGRRWTWRCGRRRPTPRCCRRPDSPTWEAATWARRWPSSSGPGRSTPDPTSPCIACPRSTTTWAARRMAEATAATALLVRPGDLNAIQWLAIAQGGAGETGGGPGRDPLGHRVRRSRTRHRGALRGLPGDHPGCWRTGNGSWSSG